MLLAIARGAPSPDYDCDKILSEETGIADTAAFREAVVHATHSLTLQHIRYIAC